MDGWNPASEAEICAIKKKPKTADRLKAEEIVEAFAASNDRCWKTVREDWNAESYEINRAMNKTAQMLRLSIKEKGFRMTVKKRRDTLYIVKE